MTILDEIKKRAAGAADTGINIADALAKEGGVEKVAGEPIATVLGAIRTKCTIEFDVNGGTGEIPDFIAVFGEECPLPDGGDLTPPEGKEAFLGWATTDNAESPDVEAPYIPEEDDTLYAVWGDIFTVTYDANGGTGEIDSVEVADGGSLELDDGSTLTPPEGKEFAGWGSTASELTPDVESPITVTDDVTLYAVWVDAAEEEQTPN